MDFAFTPEQEALRDLARSICQDHATHERLKAVEREPDVVDRDLWRALARANLLGVAIPEAHGGSGLGMTELCLVLEQLGAAVAPVPVWPSLVLAGLPLVEYGSPAQRERWLGPLAAGDAVLTAALIELPAEAPAAPTTLAVRDGAGWRLDGMKDCVPAAHVASAILVPARTGERDVGLFVVEPSAAGVRIERQVATNREIQGRLTLDGVRVGADAVVGDPAQGAAIVAWLVDRAMLGLCALELGVVERAVRITAQYAGERKQFDRPIGSFQAVQMRAADAWIDVESIRLTTWQAAWRLDAGLPASEEIRVAKFWASEAGHRITYAAQHLHGGIGVDVDYPIHRYYLWSKTLELSLGSGARQLAALGESIAAEG